MFEPKVGLSVNNVEEIERAIRVGADHVEIRPRELAESGLPMYYYGHLTLKPIQRNIAELKKICQGVPVQFHMPYERGSSVLNEDGLNASSVDCFTPLIQRFLVYESIYREYGLGKIITVHLSLYRKGEEVLAEKKEAIKNNRNFFYALDRLRRSENHQTIIGLENAMYPKKAGAILGYKPEHFTEILSETKTLGLTIDSGHLQLTEKSKLIDYLSLGMPIVNFHFHGNPGKFDPVLWDDDQHSLPTPENVFEYNEYLAFFKANNVPVTLEIMGLRNHSDKELRDFISTLKKKIINT